MSASTAVRRLSPVTFPAPAPATAGPPAIAVEGVSQIFVRDEEETHALDTVDLELGDGEFVAIVGPSGCGKSTLLRIIAGLLAPTGGDVRVMGKRVAGAVTDLGIVFQSPVLLDWRDVLGNVLVQIELRGGDPGQHVEAATRLLDAVGLGDFLGRYPHELSGGMRQRTAIVRALIHDPPLLLMDEPFGALDALTREQMRIDLEALWLARRKTVLFITHSIDEAVLLADRVVVMSPRPGRIERILPIGLPRPRGVEARQSAEYTAAAEEITAIFLERGVLHRGPILGAAGQ